MTGWTVDYGDGERPISIPHAWRQDVPAAWEGPAIYRCSVHSGTGDGFPWLVFEGVSYEAEVFVNGEHALTHRGIWDAFSVRLTAGANQVELHVYKNGGPKFPVKEVLSGFLPFVFHTFGGIYRPVRLVWASGDPLSQPLAAAPPPLVIEDGLLVRRDPLTQSQTAVELAQQWLAARQGAVSDRPAATDRHFYAKGVLSWGWYPEIGCPTPPEAEIRREIEIVKKCGFNLVKFCLWVPSHRHLELLQEEGLMAWIELPLWDPTPCLDAQSAMLEELRRIVRQYRHHPNIAFWTAGCELHESTSAAYRQSLTEMIREEVPGALVKDNSGGSEMYGGDLREYGDFYDFHPYCDTHFYPEVLDSLLPGPRRPMPILLGEFNDFDVHRSLARLREEMPYWASEDPVLNDQGVRWQHDLPRMIQTVDDSAWGEGLERSSKAKSVFIRRFVQEAVRSRDAIQGYVITGLRDTPISASGITDDSGEARFSKADLAWNNSACLFLIPNRRPPWVHGGNRPGWMDTFTHQVGRVHWRVGVHCERETSAAMEWDVVQFSWTGDRRPQGRVAVGTCEPATVGPIRAQEVGEISWDASAPGGFLLRVRFGDALSTWPIWITEAPLEGWAEALTASDPEGWLADLQLPEHESEFTEIAGPNGRIRFLTGAGAVPRPFWRECDFLYPHAGWNAALGWQGHWERWLPLASDRAFALPEGALDLMTRVDTRTCEMLSLCALLPDRTLLTTLRPFGGLGIQPRGLTRNASGMAWLQAALGWLGKDMP